jgi:hypothetical protein
MHNIKVTSMKSSKPFHIAALAVITLLATLQFPSMFEMGAQWTFHFSRKLDKKFHGALARNK